MEADATFDPRALPRSFYDKKIRELVARHVGLTAAAKEVKAEIDWWEAGRERFAADDEGPDQERLVEVDEVGPEPEPENLRAKITFVTRQGHGPMKPAAVIDALAERGWMPTAKTAPQMIRNRMLSMLDEGELERDEEGRYRYSVET